MMLWRVDLGAGELGDGAVGYEVSSGNQDLSVGEQRRCVRCANVIHVPGASGRPRVCRPVVETGVARKTVLVPPSCNQSISGTEQRQRVADSGRGHIKCAGPRPGARSAHPTPIKHPSFLAARHRYRILYATDLVVLPKDDTDKALANWNNTYERDWKFFATVQTVEYKGRSYCGVSSL